MQTTRNGVLKHPVDTMTLNIPPMTLIACLATLVVSATAPAQSVNSSLRRQQVEPSQQQPASEVNWGALRRSSSGGRSNDDRSLSNKTARILVDQTSNVVDLRNSPNQPIGQPAQPPAHLTQPITRPLRQESSQVRHASYEATPLPKVGSIPTNRIAQPTPHQTFESQADPISVNATVQPSNQSSNMAPLGHAFNSIRDERPVLQSQQAEGVSKTVSANGRFESKRQPDSEQRALLDTDQVTSDTDQPAPAALVSQN